MMYNCKEFLLVDASTYLDIYLYKYIDLLMLLYMQKEEDENEQSLALGQSRFTFLSA